MDGILQDLLQHQFWADAQLWNALGAHAPARTDRAIHDRLHHTHQVQRAFAWACGDRAEQPALTKPEQFDSFDALHHYARQSHDLVRRCLDSLSDARLDETIGLPWFPDPPLRLAVKEALAQMAMHSQHHRGQNMARLRELGAVPPPLDLIFWYWKGRPAAEW
jgi:uncharacterized damage-inducible protein DinB